uniref:P-type Zn(2+) transporter n=1 Tax=Muribaculaceae bacterium Z82 TaxID=2304548 RepID=A0A7C9NN13_9BACT
MNKKQKRMRNRIIVALALFACAWAVETFAPLEAWTGSETGALWVEFALFLVPYLVAGYDVVLKAFRNIGHGQVFDEDFLMTVATIGAFALVLFPSSEPHMAEGAAVMLFFQVGELFQSYAVGKSRESIAELMDIAPDYANVERDGRLVQVDPYELSPGDVIVVKPGERVPLDGIVTSGTSQMDTSSLTGESVPRTVRDGDEVISGCVNMTGVLTVAVTKPFAQSTVSRILELVENASDKKARTESFITRFARYYTPAVVGVAAALAVLPPLLLGQPWETWVERGLVFLVVSCPCALVISVPLSFFGGIGGASRAGVLVKGSNYLEALAHAKVVAFDKTGTLTSGTFEVVSVKPAAGRTAEELLETAALAESFSDHPIALSVRRAARRETDGSRVRDAQEFGGHGVSAVVDGAAVLVGNDKLMAEHAVDFVADDAVGTVLYVAVDGSFAGSIVIADRIKPQSAQAIADLHKEGIRRTVMLTGDRADVARAIAERLGLDDVRSQLLPQQKVEQVEMLLAEVHGQGRGRDTLAFVGDGINDAPVLMRADVGVAMGALGSDAAIEAADVVLMDDDPVSIARAVNIAKKTLSIVWQNIVFALGVKFAVLALASLGLANMWMAVFADVGVAVIAILNAMRAMNAPRKPIG